MDGLVDRLSQEWGWAGGGCALYRGQLTIKSPLPCCIISLLLLFFFFNVAGVETLTKQSI